MKRLLLSLILLLAFGIGALAWTFTAGTLEPAPPYTGSLPAASPPPEMSLSSLPTGSMDSQAGLAYRGGRFSEPRRFSMDAILVRHPRGDLLFDAGFGKDIDSHFQQLPALMRTLSKYQKGTPAGEQLSANGYAIKNLAGVVLTHAHFDHVSGLDSLPGVPVWVNQAESDFIEGGSRNSALARSFGALNYKRYAFNGGPYLGFASSLDVWGDGSVLLVPAPGHTPGSIIAFIALPSGVRYVLLGDLVWQMEGIELPAERPWLPRRLIGEDDAQVRGQIAQIAALHQQFPQLRLVPAHDSRIAATLPVFPAKVQ
ncbi:MAG: MBL fold metallo-hydrolase [Pseudomonadota bacterium]